MTRSLVTCLLLACVAGLVATTSALLAGWGFLAAFALYSATGSASLLAALAVQAEAPRPVTAQKPGRRTKDEPSFA